MPYVNRNIRWVEMQLLKTELELVCREFNPVLCTIFPHPSRAILTCEWDTTPVSHLVSI